MTQHTIIANHLFANKVPCCASNRCNVVSIKTKSLFTSAQYNYIPILSNSQYFKNFFLKTFYLHSIAKVKSTQIIFNSGHNSYKVELNFLFDHFLPSFKIMKSDLDARPVFLQKEEPIKGHFLICYIAVLLERILQFKVLQNKYSTSEIFDFIKNFKATKAESKYINTTTYSDFIDDLSKIFGLPLTNYFLTETQIKSMFNYKL
jgi:hypothetical protein